jgi:ABC-type Fe3+/spermidine/putrescine transport system ATPase subunit
VADPVGGASPFLEVRGVAKRFSRHAALADCTLALRQGEIVTLLGPSGCGKTTLLRCIAGFVVPDEGTIAIAGADALALPVNRRPVGVVFQSYALFPHLTVAGNVGYGLKMRGTKREAIAARVADALRLVSLEGLDGRYPAQLSGGQQQRVAIARVLVLEPKLLLLDEPFNALDAKLRGAMQIELRRLIKRLGLTALFVTHDQDEALAVSDRIAVMRAGQIEQVGTPSAIYDRPATPHVAGFVGLSNLLPARAAGGAVILPDGTTLASPHDGAVLVMVRPHNLALTAGASGSWRGRIAFGRPAGATMEYEVELGDGVPVRVAAGRSAAEPVLEPGAAVTIAVRDAAGCVVFAGSV